MTVAKFTKAFKGNPMKTKEFVDQNTQTSRSNYTPNQENFKHNNNNQQNKNNQEPIEVPVMLTLVWFATKTKSKLFG